MLLDRLLNCAVTQPIDIAQANVARPQRLARADYEAAHGRIEVHHIKRRA
jgi:hypothetical protein